MVLAGVRVWIGGLEESEASGKETKRVFGLFQVAVADSADLKVWTVEGVRVVGAAKRAEYALVGGCGVYGQSNCAEIFGFLRNVEELVYLS